MSGDNRHYEDGATRYCTVQAGRTPINAQGAQGVQIGNWNIQHVNLNGLKVIYGSPSVDPRVYHFLCMSFMEVVPRSAHLFECRGTRAARGVSSQCTPRMHSVLVVAQIAEDEPTAVPVSSTDFRTWLNSVEKQSIFLLHGSLRPSGIIRWRALCLHDWLLRDATRQPRWENLSNFPLSVFRSVGAHGARFHQAVVQEVDRVTGEKGGMWRTLQDAGLVPVDEMTLLEFMKLARFLEVPQPVFRQLAALGRPTDLVVNCIRRGRSTCDPVIDSWLSTVRALAREEPAGVERRNFRLFVRFLERRGRGVRLPRYSSREAGYWRVFTAMYPEVLEGLRHVVRSSNVGNDVTFAASLVPTLVLANDRVVSLNASNVLRELPDRRQDFSEYYVRREILRSLVEGGERQWLAESIQLIAGEGSSGAEQRYLNSYGWKTDQVEAKIERRLNRPTLRDQQMRECLEVMGDVFSRTRRNGSSRGFAYQASGSC